MALTKRDKEIAALRDQALMVALTHLVEFINPDDDHCDVDPEVRKASAQFLETWVAGPLADALNMYRLGEYRHCNSTRSAREYLDELKAASAR